MATSVHAFYNAIRDVQVTIAETFGVILPKSTRETRSIAASNGVSVAVLIRALENKGLITPADLQTAWAQAKSEDWSDVIPQD